MSWKSVGSAVGSALPLIGTILGGPFGGAVGSIAASALGVENTPDAVHAALKNDPEAMVKLREAEMTHEKELQAMLLQSEASKLESVNATIRAEATSGNWFVAGWRPAFGYMMALTWGAQMLAISYVIVRYPTDAGHVISAMGALGVIWSVALSVVGVSVWQRSKDKATVAGANPVAGFDALSKIFKH